MNRPSHAWNAGLRSVVGLAAVTVLALSACGAAGASIPTVPSSLVPQVTIEPGMSGGTACVDAATLAVFDQLKAPGANISPSLYCGMATDDLQGIIKQNAATLPGLKETFCTRFMPWYWTHLTGGSNDVASVIDAPQPKMVGGEEIMSGDDVCIPAFWRDHALVAYSRQGYAAKNWKLPPGWENVTTVKISEVTMEGLKEVNRIGVTNHTVTLSLAFSS